MRGLRQDLVKCQECTSTGEFYVVSEHRGREMAEESGWTFFKFKVVLLRS